MKVFKNILFYIDLEKFFLQLSLDSATWELHLYSCQMSEPMNSLKETWKSKHNGNIAKDGKTFW